MRTEQPDVFQDTLQWTFRKVRDSRSFWFRDVAMLIGVFKQQVRYDRVMWHEWPWIRPVVIGVDVSFRYVFSTIEYISHNHLNKLPIMTSFYGISLVHVPPKILACDPGTTTSNILPQIIYRYLDRPYSKKTLPWHLSFLLHDCLS